MGRVTKHGKWMHHRSGSERPEPHTYILSTCSYMIASYPEGRTDASDIFWGALHLNCAGCEYKQQCISARHSLLPVLQTAYRHFVLFLPRPRGQNAIKVIDNVLVANDVGILEHLTFHNRKVHDSPICDRVCHRETAKRDGIVSSCCRVRVGGRGRKDAVHVQGNDPSVRIANPSRSETERHGFVRKRQLGVRQEVYQAKSSRGVLGRPSSASLRSAVRAIAQERDASLQSGQRE